jgi:hypothetical protein
VGIENWELGSGANRKKKERPNIRINQERTKERQESKGRSKTFSRNMITVSLKETYTSEWQAGRHEDMMMIGT